MGYKAWNGNANLKIASDNSKLILENLEKIEKTNPPYWSKFLRVELTANSKHQVRVKCNLHSDGACTEVEAPASYFKFLAYLQGWEYLKAGRSILDSLAHARSTGGEDVARDVVNQLFEDLHIVSFREKANKTLGLSLSKEEVRESLTFRHERDKSPVVGGLGQLDPDSNPFLYNYLVWAIRVRHGEEPAGWQKTTTSIKFRRMHDTDQFLRILRTLAVGLTPWLERSDGLGSDVSVDLTHTTWAGGSNTPPHVCLLHELIHAHHFATGSGYQSAAWEEAQTVGMHPFSHMPYCENRFRLDASLPRRVIYNMKSGKVDPSEAFA